jgi:hypothetical protein
VLRRAQLLRFVIVATSLAFATGLAAIDAIPGAAAELPDLAARRTIERSVHTAYPDLAFGNVACPSGIVRARGVTFTCTVQLPGTFLVVDAKQTDGSGNVALTTQQAVIPTQALRDFVAKNASLAATVDCGPAPVRVARANQVITCQAKLADGTTRAVDHTVQDAAGTVTISAVR